MPPLSVIFFGTETFAATILEALITSPLVRVDLVVTQPDRPVGRKQTPTAPPVKLTALAAGISVVQPATLKEYTLPITADIGVVAQYGLLIPESILQTPRLGVLNVHTSLLPKYRGATPIQSALIHGETTTGVTIMKMDKGLDTGPILLQKSHAISPTDTYATLDEALAPIGAAALLEALPLYADGTLVPTAQNTTEATTCREFNRDTGRVDWKKSAKDIVNLYRGTYPRPGTWTLFGTERLKLLEIIEMAHTDQVHKPGTVEVRNHQLLVHTGSGIVRVPSLQREGKKPVTDSEFLHGTQQIKGTVFE